MKTLKITLTALTLALSFSSFASADTEIGGDATVVGLVNGSAVAIAAGLANDASNNVGAIMDGSTVGGDAVVVGLVNGSTVAIAAGLANDAHNNIGVIGGK